MGAIYIAKRHTFEFIEEQFKIKGYELLETEYVNSKTKMRFLCPKHGEVSIRYNNLQSGHGCPKCGNESVGDKQRLSYEFVKSQFEKYDCELLSEEYVDNSSQLQYICLKHKNEGIQSIIYNSLQQGQGCYYCGKELTSKKLRLDFKIVQKAFKQRNYKLLSKKEDYIDSHTNNMKYICPNHPNDVQSISYSNLKNGYGCPMCAIDRNSGENCHLWKGGVTSLVRYLRPQLNPWVQQQLQRANYRCELTGKQGTLNVHHMFSFKKILDITMKELNMDIRSTIGEYSDDELQLVTTNLIKNNDILANPKVLLESVHQEFHAFCGGNQVDTTQGLWDSFVLQYKSEVA